MAGQGEVRVVSGEPSEPSRRTSAQVAAEYIVPRPHRRRAHVVLYAVIVVAAMIAILVPLSVIPVSHGFAFSLSVCPAGGSQLEQFTSGASVGLTWDEPVGTPVHMTIQQGTQVIYDRTTGTGTFTFTSDGEPYQFVANSNGGSCTSSPVDVSGTWSAPLL